MLTIVAATLCTALPVHAAVILFQDDNFSTVQSSGMILGFHDAGGANTTIRFGDNANIANNGNITWNINNNTFTIDHPLNVTGDLTATGIDNTAIGNAIPSTGAFTTINAGTWNGNKIGLAYGGTNTNLSSGAAIGDLLYSDSTTSFARIPDVATGNALLSGGTGVAPSYGKVGLGSSVSGTLPVANGGTGQSSLTANDVILGNGLSPVNFIAPGASGNILTSNGTNWTSGGPGQPSYPVRQWCFLSPLGVTATVFTSFGCAAFVVNGTAASSAQPDSYYISYLSSATANALAGITQTFIQTEGRYRPKLTTLIRTDSTIDNRRIWIALASAALAATDGSGALATRYVGVRYSTAAGDITWKCASGDGTTGSVIDTGVPVTASTAYLISIDWSVDGTLTCTVNGTSVAKTTNLDITETANLGLQDLLTTLTASAKTYLIAFIELETK